jgi:hypothetical protein
MKTVHKLKLETSCDQYIKTTTGNAVTFHFLQTFWPQVNNVKILLDVTRNDVMHGLTLLTNGFELVEATSHCGCQG